MGNSDDRGEWIRFGDGPAMLCHPETAGKILAELWKADKPRFGRYVAIAMTGVAPIGGGRKTHGQGEADDQGGAQ